MSNLKYKHTAYTSAQWASLNPVIVENEIVIESDTKRTKIGNGISTYNELEYADANSVGNSLGSIKPTDPAPTPARNGNYTFSVGGNKPAWLTAEAGVTTVKAGDGVSVVYTAPSSYTYTHVDTGSTIEQVRSQSQSKSPSSKLIDDELSRKASLIPGKNLFNINDPDYLPGYAIAYPNGSIIANVDYCTTGYIPVIIGNTITGNCLSGYNIRIINFYDVNKVLLSTSQKIANIVIPANCHYCRISFFSTRLASAYQVEYGNSPSSYEQFVLKLDENSIPETIARVSEIPVIEKIATLVVGKNLFNKNDSDCKLGFYVLFSNGTLLPNAAYNATGYIPILASTNYAFSTNIMLAFYDVNKTYISGVTTGFSNPLTSPSNAAYVRCSVVIANWSTFQVEQGNASTSYVKYGMFLSESNIPATIQRANTSSDAAFCSKLYLTAQKTDLFFEPIVKNMALRFDRFIRLSVTNATINRHFRKLVTITPTSSGVATFSIYNESFNLLQTKAVTTVVTPLSKTGNLKTMFVGSSITRGAEYIEYLKTMCSPGVSFLGTRITNAGGVKHEGRGGWGLLSYKSIEKTKTRSSSPFYHPSIGRYWGVVEFWQDVMSFNEFAGSENVNAYEQNGYKTSATAIGFLSTGYISGAKLLTNDIMYSISAASFKQWDGSAWNNIAQPSTWEINLAKYGAMWNISAPDILFLAELGTNDFRANATDPNFATWDATVELFLTSLKEWNASSKLGVAVPISTFGQNTDSLNEWNDRNNYRMWQHRADLVSHFDDREGEGIYLIDDAIFYDQDYGFALSTDSNFTKPNQEYTGAELLRIQSANPHPDTPGRKLLGRGFLGIIQHLRS